VYKVSNLQSFWKKSYIELKWQGFKIVAIDGIYFKGLVINEYKRCGNELLKIISYKPYDFRKEILDTYNLWVMRYE
jgi:hypothetical protein